MRKHISPVGICFLFLAFAIFPSCAPVPVLRPGPPFAPQRIADLVSMIREQESMVHSFISSGRLVVKGHGPETDLNILTVGTRNPVKIKIEITHPWGRPLMHILVQHKSLHILSFHEKRYYMGNLGSIGSSGSFPVHLEPEQIWTLLRGYPVLLNHNHAVSTRARQIKLLSAEGNTVQIIDFHPGGNLPHRISFPGIETRITFSDFENEDGIHYARDMELNDPRSGSILPLHLKQMVFNKAIPEAIFRLEKPAGFELIK